MMSELKCPKCKSNQITAQKKGFSAGKAVAGVVLTGGVGALAGMHGSNDIEVHCLSCGHTWNPVKRFEQQKQQQLQADRAAYAKRKKKFYQAYESGDMELAVTRVPDNLKYMLNQRGVEGVYKHLKSADTTAVVMMVLFTALMAGFIFWFLS